MGQTYRRRVDCMTTEKVATVNIKFIAEFTRWQQHQWNAQHNANTSWWPPFDRVTCKVDDFEDSAAAYRWACGDLWPSRKLRACLYSCILSFLPYWWRRAHVLCKLGGPLLPVIQNTVDWLTCVHFRVETHRSVEAQLKNRPACCEWTHVLVETQTAVCLENVPERNELSVQQNTEHCATNTAHMCDWQALVRI